MSSVRLQTGFYYAGISANATLINNIFFNGESVAFEACTSSAWRLPALHDYRASRGDQHQRWLRRRPLHSQQCRLQFCARDGGSRYVRVEGSKEGGSSVPFYNFLCVFLPCLRRLQLVGVSATRSVVLRRCLLPSHVHLLSPHASREPYHWDAANASVVDPLPIVIDQNLFVNNYKSSWPIDNDDGSNGCGPKHAILALPSLPHTPHPHSPPPPSSMGDSQLRRVEQLPPVGGFKAVLGLQQAHAL